MRARLFTHYQPDEIAANIRAAGFVVQESWIGEDATRSHIKWINLIAVAE